MHTKPTSKSEAELADQIVLVGLPGSGKSTVGPLLAVQIGWRFVDLDIEIENATGQQIAEIFLKQGEAAFRSIERELTLRLASEPQLVLAPGGGWVLFNNLPGSVTVWLKVNPAEAVARLGEGAGARPLLKPDPLTKMKELLAIREPHYAKADIAIDTEGKTAYEIATAIATAIGK